MIKLEISRKRRARYGVTANGVPFERRELQDFYNRAPHRLRRNPFATKIDAAPVEKTS